MCCYYGENYLWDMSLEKVKKRNGLLFDLDYRTGFVNGKLPLE
jgi:hypothetical protein